MKKKLHRQPCQQKLQVAIKCEKETSSAATVSQ